jgi:hypothetical protein
VIDPSDHARVIEERNELGRQNHKHEKALREIVACAEMSREEGAPSAIDALKRIITTARGSLTGSVAGEPK